MNEHSPLLSAQRDDHACLNRELGRLLELDGGEVEESKSFFYLFILTLSIGG